MGVSVSANYSINGMTDIGDISLICSNLSGLKVQFSEGKGLNIYPFSSFLITNVLDTDVKSGLWFNFRGSKIGNYHVSRDFRESPVSTRITNIGIQISFNRQGIIFKLNADNKDSGISPDKTVLNDQAIVTEIETDCFIPSEKMKEIFNIPSTSLFDKMAKLKNA